MYTLFVGIWKSNVTGRPRLSTTSNQRNLSVLCGFVWVMVSLGPYMSYNDFHSQCVMFHEVCRSNVQEHPRGSKVRLLDVIVCP